MTAQDSILDPYLIDAKPLVEAFRESDDRLPRIVFALLGHYIEHGPFTFDATAISEWLRDSTSVDRPNPEMLAALQPELELFFEPTPQGWVPRRGVLAAH